MTGNADDPRGATPRPITSGPSGQSGASLPDGRVPRPRVPRQVWFEAKLAAASHEVLVLNTLSGALGDPIAAFRSIDKANVRRGVRYRMLLPDRARVAATSASQLPALVNVGADVRTVSTVPTDALVFDGSVTYLPSGRNELAEFQIPAVVGAVTELFERLWSSAMPLNAGDPTQRGTADRERELLTLLCLGWSDDLVAARLGVSVRTVRRMIAGIMNRLGARSRFQAGFKAADTGWIKRAE